MKLLYLFILCSSYIFSSKNPLHEQSNELERLLNNDNLKFVVRELNYDNPQEIDKACDIYDIKSFIENRTTPNKQADPVNLLICTTPHENSTICGVLAYVKYTYQPKIMILELAVHQNHQRKGVASDLISHMEKSIDPSIKSVNMVCSEKDTPRIACMNKNGFYQTMDNKFSRCVCSYDDPGYPPFLLKKYLPPQHNSFTRYVKCKKN